MPRPKLRPDDGQRNLVKSLAACGVPHEQIARRIGLRSPKTLRTHFRRELDDGVSEANYTVAKSLYKSAPNGDTDAAKFWLKCRAGWREHSSHAEPDGSLPPFIVAKEEE